MSAKFNISIEGLEGSAVPFEISLTFPSGTRVIIEEFGSTVESINDALKACEVILLGYFGKEVGAKEFAHLNQQIMAMKATQP